MEHIIEWIVNFVRDFGYLGVFVMTFLESTFVPIPSEVTMVPAGYLIYKGEMNFWYVFLCSVSGTLGGALFNYWLACKIGRPLMERYHKYLLLSEKRIAKLDRFFESHGEISMFTGRLIPGLRHFISFPAGLARMNVGKFSLYTSAGGSIWMLVLIATGYFIGGNEELIHRYLGRVGWSAAALAVVLVSGYVYYIRRTAQREGILPADASGKE